MKKYTRSIIFFSIFYFTSKAFAADLQGEELIRQKIEIICLDVWCEGTTKYRFDRVEFNKQLNKTVIYSQMAPPVFPAVIFENTQYKATIRQKMYNVRCEIEGFSDADQILEAGENIHRKFYESLSDCLTSIDIPLRSLGNN